KGVDVRAFTTEESADDVEALRRALGVPKVSLAGFSYGTHLVLSVLRRHPQGVARAVLIATEGPADTWKYPETLDLQLTKLSYLATGSDAMVRSFDRVMQKLAKDPLIVPVRLKDDAPAVDVKVSAFGLQRILIEDLGDSSDFVLFPAMLQMLEAGDPSLLARYVEKRYRGMAGGVPLMSLAMDCASGASPERLAEIERQAAASRFPLINFPYPHICAQLGVVDLGERFRSAVASDVPALFISGTLDYQTPPYQAERAMWGFTNARHIVVTHGAHEDLDSNREVGMRVAAFLRGEEVKSGTIEAPRPKFLSVEEVKQRLRPH
ncbi:MAG TPA: alpha/beta fold hydrolase, partial [Thermoanaerobaculia bacterium]|nr:alpha/beta fold hydrolase [Thermoanaerobaculia bacterium]